MKANKKNLLLLSAILTISIAANILLYKSYKRYKNTLQVEARDLMLGFSRAVPNLQNSLKTILETKKYIKADIQYLRLYFVEGIVSNKFLLTRIADGINIVDKKGYDISLWEHEIKVFLEASESNSSEGIEYKLTQKDTEALKLIEAYINQHYKILSDNSILLASEKSENGNINDSELFYSARHMDTDDLNWKNTVKLLLEIDNSKAFQKTNLWSLELKAE